MTDAARTGLYRGSLFSTPQNRKYNSSRISLFGFNILYHCRIGVNDSVKKIAAFADTFLTFVFAGVILLQGPLVFSYHTRLTISVIYFLYVIVSITIKIVLKCKKHREN